MKTYLFATGSLAGLIVAAVLLAACDGIPEETDGTGSTGTLDGTGPGATSTTAGTGGGEPTFTGTPIDVPVPVTGRVFLDLDTVALVDEASAWDLAFEGYDVFTNSGPSGPGSGGAFGPNDVVSFLTGEIPAVPFLFEDRAGGAFVDWYDYDGTTHQLYARFHLHGIQSGGTFYKLQVLGYYGEIEGAPVSAVYQLRYAPVTEGGSGTTVVLEGIDGTAGGPSPGADDPSACVVLATQEIRMLTPAQAATDPAWDLCFRRDAIMVNGGEGGPGQTTAVDFDAPATETETLDQVKARTAATQLAAFDAADWAFLHQDGFEYRGDGVVSAFTGQWRDTTDPMKPAHAGWIVRAADGATPFFVTFESFTGATASGPGTVRAYVSRPTGGSLP